MTSPPTSWLDHFVVGIHELAQGVAAFTQMSGVAPEFGGEHPNLGTHNSLVSLGEPVYLEILAPRPGAEVSPLFAAAQEHTELTPILWACATDDAQAIHDALVEAGFNAGPIVAGSRVTSDGQELRWKMFMMGAGSPQNAPFFIEWHPETVHPAKSTPPGCKLKTYRVGSADPEQLRTLLGVAGMDPDVVSPGKRSAIELETPEGRVVLEA